MDIGLYFDPVDFDLLGQEEKFSKYSLGYQIRKDTIKALHTKMGSVKAALLGVPYEPVLSNKGTAGAPAVIRKHLYRMGNLEGLGGIIDLGDLKTGRSVQDIYYAMRDVVEYLGDLGIVAVVLGGGQDLTTGIARSFRDCPDFTLSVVDARVDMKSRREMSDSSGFIRRILHENPRLFHLQMIGIQSHLVSSSILEQFREKTFGYIQLGRLRDDFTVAEPVLRNTTFLSFDISSVRQSDAAGHCHPSPNGLQGEEACRLAHYAGLSSKMKVFGIFEVNPEYDPREMTADLAAQMVWYFLEAFAHRKDVDPARDKTPFIQYFVEADALTLPFYLHAPTGRWWIEVPAGEESQWIIPCHEDDYSLACRHEIPDIWWKYARKSDRLSK